MCNSSSNEILVNVNFDMWAIPFPFLMEASAKQHYLQLETVFNLLYANTD